ncbi:MAG: hypothetical protein HN337_01700 [Deltaproteobacteria bacterium]|nr:hypothetical protein [Deltaproteobacteria bacterium]
MNYSDLGNAKRLIAYCKGEIRYCPELGGWFYWDGKRWVFDLDFYVYRKAKELITGYYGEAENEKDSEIRMALAKHSLDSESTKNIKAMIESAKSEPGVVIHLEEFDQNKWLFNVENGTIDLRTGEIREHRKEDLIRKLAPVTYDKNNEYTMWKEFLRTILPEQQVRYYLQQIAGMSLTGDISERLFFMIYGPGANGKTTFINVLGAMMGDYCVSIPPESLLRGTTSTSASSAIAATMGARLIITVEPEEGARLRESLVKQMTGEDMVTARYLYKNFTTFYSQGKILLATNYKPTIRETKKAIWDRIRLITFPVSFSEKERIKGFAHKLEEELSGILNWVIEGCLAWQNDGLLTPGSVRAATEEYRKEMDTIELFMDERCVTGAHEEVRVSKLYSVYTNWCIGSRETPLTKRAFGMKLKERGFEQRRTRDWRFWTGIGVHPNHGSFEMDISPLASFLETPKIIPN